MVQPLRSTVWHFWKSDALEQRRGWEVLGQCSLMVLMNIFNKFNGEVCIICNYQFGGEISSLLSEKFISFPLYLNLTLLKQIFSIFKKILLSFLPGNRISSVGNFQDFLLKKSVTYTFHCWSQFYVIMSVPTIKGNKNLAGKLQDYKGDVAKPSSQVLSFSSWVGKSMYDFALFLSINCGLRKICGRKLTFRCNRILREKIMYPASTAVAEAKLNGRLWVLGNHSTQLQLAFFRQNEIPGNDHGSSLREH